MGWLEANVELVNIAVQFGLLLVWGLYFQLLLNGMRRQRRPRLLINQGVGSGLQSRCIISNMSEEAIYVEAVIAGLRTTRGQRQCPITDFELDGADAGSVRVQDATTQGPLGSGDYRDIGSFETIVRRASRMPLEEGDHAAPMGDDERALALELRVVAIYVSEDLPVGGERVFDLVGQAGERVVRPQTVDTRNFGTRRERRRMKRVLERFL